MKMTENEIQGLKAQEAKDLAVRLLKQLEAKETAPVSAGEVQLIELEYELKLKEAEVKDNRQREAHEERIRELELQIEQERARQAEANDHAESVRQEHVQLVEQVRASNESLSVQLERATREHNVRIETLEAGFKKKKDELSFQLDAMESRRDSLRAEISDLADLRETVEDVAQLHETIETTRKQSQQELHELEEQIAAAEFERNKKINEIRRKQELALTELKTQHEKHILQANQEAAESILSKSGRVAVDKKDWEQLHKDLTARTEKDETEVAAIREAVQSEFRKTYNITAANVIDVTELFYKHQAATREVDLLRAQADKLDSEIRRMREHIENEPQRIATAVEAAKVQVHNTIEQASGR